VGFRAWLPGWTPSPNRGRPSSAPVLCPHGETPGTGEPRRVENDHRGILPHPYDIAEICEVRSEFAAHPGHGRKRTCEPGKAGEPEKPHISAFTRSLPKDAPEPGRSLSDPGCAGGALHGRSSPRLRSWVDRRAWSFGWCGPPVAAVPPQERSPGRRVPKKSAEQVMDGRCVAGILEWPPGWPLKKRGHPCKRIVGQ
jgi:hypothetical protein